MDADRFDTLLRSLATSPSRRGALRLLAGSPLGSLLMRDPLSADAKKKGGGKKKCKGKAKVTICHKGQTIQVSSCALKAHQKHGDTVGACPGQNPPPPPECATTADCSNQIEFCQGGQCVPVWRPVRARARIAVRRAPCGCGTRRRLLHRLFAEGSSCETDECFGNQYPDCVIGEGQTDKICTAVEPCSCTSTDDCPGVTTSCQNGTCQPVCTDATCGVSCTVPYARRTVRDRRSATPRSPTTGFPAPMLSIVLLPRGLPAWYRQTKPTAQTQARARTAPPSENADKRRLQRPAGHRGWLPAAMNLSSPRMPTAPKVFFAASEKASPRYSLPDPDERIALTVLPLGGSASPGLVTSCGSETGTGCRGVQVYVHEMKVGSGRPRGPVRRGCCMSFGSIQRRTTVLRALIAFTVMLLLARSTRLPGVPSPSPVRTAPSTPSPSSTCVRSPHWTRRSSASSRRRRRSTGDPAR